MSTYQPRDTVTLHHGDALALLATLDDNSAHAVVTDPPYGIAFMGKGWDTVDAYAAWCEKWASECLRILRPGGHLLAFGGTRTWHHLATGIENAGFEVRDSIAWIYGSGFPKSLDVGKAIDKTRDDRDGILRVTAFVAAARDRAGLTNRDIDAVFGTSGMAGHWTTNASQPSCPTLEQWETLRGLLGFAPDMDAEVWRLNGRKGTPGEAWDQREAIGTKQAVPGVAFSSEGPSELDITAPATDAARQWDGWGTALKPAHEPIVLARKPLSGTVAATVQQWGTGAMNIDACRISAEDAEAGRVRHGGGTNTTYAQDAWTQQHQATMGAAMPAGRWPTNVALDTDAAAALDHDADGRIHGASRFFPVFRYQAKAPRKERPEVDGIKHPTVKPLELMRWLCRLVTPPGGTVLDPFAGSGTTLRAAYEEGMASVGIEAENSYLPLILSRFHEEEPEPDDDPALFDLSGIPK